MIDFKILNSSYGEEALGLIPNFLSEDDPLPAAKQFDKNYQHGGGWTPMKGWTMGPVGEVMYPHDPALHPIAVATLHRQETIYVYRHSWVAITQPDGSFEISRMD